MATTDGFDIGPFNEGLNQAENPRMIGDGELAVCQNLDIGRAGELSIRPGLRLINSFSGGVRLLGTVLLSNNTNRAFWRYNADNALAYEDGIGIVSGAEWIGMGTTAAGITEKVVQYVNSAWFIPKGTGAVGVRQMLDTNAVSTIAAMPRGSGAIVFKDRLFIFGPVDANDTVTQRVYYSAATDFTSFPASNFFDINPGDGEGVTAAISISDTLIFFKRHSTWALFYDTDPGLGVLRKVNPEIGATGPDSVIAFENVIYLIDERTVYQIQSLLFTDIGANISLKSERQSVTFNASTQDFVVNFGSKILFAVYTGQLIEYDYYVYNTEINAWTQYTFAEQPNRFYSVISTLGFRDFIAGKHNSNNLYIISPFREDDEAFGDYPAGITPVALATKQYNGGPGSRFKRLFWWGMEAYSDGPITMTSSAVNGVDSEPTVVDGEGEFRFFKAFSPQRFRYIQFFIVSTAPDLRLQILPGLAYLGRNKNEVSNAVNA